MRAAQKNAYQGRHAGAYDPRTSPRYYLLRIGAVLLMLTLLVWPFAEPFFLQVEEKTLTFADFPQSIGQLTVVYLADIHFGGLYGEARLQSLVDRVNFAKPDLVLLGGDYAASSDTAIEFFRCLPPIRAKYGTFAVMGNHDRTLPESNLSRLTQAMRDAGVTPLVNAVSRVRIGSESICIAGIDDVYNGHPELAAVAGETSSEAFTIFLSHSPLVIDEATRLTDGAGNRAWFDLGLFGHTHGGQVAWLGPMLRKDSVPEPYRQGWLLRSRAQLLITRGVGTSGAPVRWLCPPQMHILTIKPAQ